MRISLWQQVSSNHSSNFTVVGKFESPELAQRAATEFKDIFDSIEEWQMQTGQFPRERGIPPTPPEIEFSQKYGIQSWKEALDWLHAREVRLFDNHLIVTNHYKKWGDVTYQPPTVVEDLMHYFSQLTLISEEAGPRSITFDLTCTAPNKIVAFELFDRANAIYELQDHEENRNYGAAEYSLRPQLEEAVSKGDDDLAKSLQTQLDDIWPTRQRLKMEAEKEPFLNERLHWGYLVNPFTISKHERGVDQNGLIVNFYELGFYELTELQEIIRWLETKGFYNIQYTLEQKSWDDEVSK